MDKRQFLFRLSAVYFLFMAFVFATVMVDRPTQQATDGTLNDSSTETSQPTATANETAQTPAATPEQTVTPATPYPGGSGECWEKGPNTTVCE